MTKSVRFLSLKAVSRSSIQVSARLRDQVDIRMRQSLVDRAVTPLHQSGGMTGTQGED